jgi:diguanylate cyclase (GGDEF)-like protein/PAS domain S-box-containing protein
MSYQPVAPEAGGPPAPAAAGDPGVAPLHPRLQQQLAAAATQGGTDWPRLLRLISEHYEQLDAERRGIVRSMQLIADEAHAAGSDLAGMNAAHLQAILDHIKDVVITVGTDGAIRVFNPTGERVFGYVCEEVIGRPITDLLPGIAIDGSIERGLAALTVGQVLDLQPRTFSARHKGGRHFPAELVASCVRIEQRDVYVLCLRDASERMAAEEERRRAEVLTAGERDVFQRIASDADLTSVLSSIAALIESVNASFIASIARLDAQAQYFVEVVGDRLPPRWREIELGMPIDLRNGSSAAAVYLGRQVMVAEVARDPFWQRRRELALELGLQAAWAVPIQAANGRVLGAVGVYRCSTGAAQPHDLQLLSHAAQLAGIAIERHNSAAAVRDSEAKYRSLYERVLDGVYCCAPDGRLVEVNPAFVRMLGYDKAAELYALPGIAALYEEPQRRAELEQALQAHGVVHNAEAVLRRADGTSLVVLQNERLLYDADSRLIGYEGTVADITARKAAEQAMFAEKERAQVTLQSIGDAVISTDREGRIDYMNPIAARLTGWQSDEAVGERLGGVMRLRDELSDAEPDSPLVRCLRDGQVAHSSEHCLLINRQGQELAIQESAAPIRDRAGQIIGAVVVFRDVTKERRLKRALSYQASHDALTGLINRREFDNRLAEALRSAHEQQRPHALLYMDLDQFKLVNDACGHSAGDRLLRDMTGLLQASVRAGDTIARLGGDEFGILMQRCNGEQAMRTAETIRQAVQDYRFNWDQHTSRIGASIGVVEINAESQNVATLLSAADIACYAAKDAGRNRVHRYDSHLHADRQRDLYWVGRVTHALEQDRLELFCQPIVTIGATPRGQPPLYELLIRLRDDDGELVLPRHFIPAAERYNVVASIDRWVLRSALQVLREQPQQAQPPCQLALNLSGTSLGDRDFLEYVLAEVNGPLAQGLCFEITEAAVLRRMSEAVNFMQELRARGCRFALAGFGSELSSFRYLKTLPIDYLKLDGECTDRVLVDPVDRCLIEAIASAARAVGIATIAEKVESAAVFAELQRLGVELAQGLFIAPPEPIILLHAPLAEAAGVSAEAAAAPASSALPASADPTRADPTGAGSPAAGLPAPGSAAAGTAAA